MHVLRRESLNTHSEEHLMPCDCLPLTNELIHWPDPFSQSIQGSSNSLIKHQHKRYSNNYTKLCCGLNLILVQN